MIINFDEFTKKVKFANPGFSQKKSITPSTHLEVRSGSEFGFPGSEFYAELEFRVRSVRATRNTELGSPTEITRLDS